MATGPFYSTMPGPEAVQMLNDLWLAMMNPIPVAYAASVDIDITQSSRVFGPITMTGALALNFTGDGVALGDESMADYDGKTFIVWLKQDATGSRLWTPGAGIRLGTDIPSVTLTTTPNKLDRLGFQYVHSAAKCDLIAHARGY